MQAEIDRSSSKPLAATPPAVVPSYGNKGGVVDEAEGEKAAKEKLAGDLQQAEITALKASIDQLHLEQAKSDGAMKEMVQLNRNEAEERERALKVAEER